ncbi:MAG TPA: hypothetical protein VK064_03220 [Wenzhouxiangella sp.]|nr:hypothetical protein [Wenzhouxiangella sp.]
MSSRVSSRELPNEILGKTISGVIARPGRPGEPPVVMMLHFEDGSAVEFVSPRSDRLLRRAVQRSQKTPSVQPQLSLLEHAMSA